MEQIKNPIRMLEGYNMKKTMMHPIRASEDLATRHYDKIMAEFKNVITGLNDESSKKIMEGYEEMFKIRGGEKESLALASELKLPMMCDDKKGINVARVLDIKRGSAIIVLETLYKKKKIRRVTL